MRRYIESGVKGIFVACAAASTLSVVFITLFVFIEGVPLFFRSVDGNTPPTLTAFLFGTDWYPIGSPPNYGIAPFIVASLMVTVGALTIAVPVGVAVGIFIAEIVSGWPRRVLRGATEVLAGIPSVVYGFFGVMMIGFFLGRVNDPLINYNAFSAMLILSIMTLPTIITITEVSIRSVPQEYREAAFSLGSTHWQTIARVLLPGAKSGIATGILLGMGRAIGETLAVLMVAGNQPTLPTDGVRSRVRTLTMAIINDMGYSAGDHRTALFTIAIVLFLFILALNATAQMIMWRSRSKP